MRDMIDNKNKVLTPLVVRFIQVNCEFYRQMSQNFLPLKGMEASPMNLAEAYIQPANNGNPYIKP